jgi:hypothetical protein
MMMRLDNVFSNIMALWYDNDNNYINFKIRTYQCTPYQQQKFPSSEEVCSIDQKWQRSISTTN